MSEQMEFPITFEKFAKEYGFKDDKEVYTNGSDLIPIFRVNQWLEQDNRLRTMEMDTAYECGKHANKWIPCSERLPEVHESGNLFSGIFMESDPVLVYGICEYEENAQFHVVTYCDDLNGNTYWSTELDALTITGVIAWLPLPEPYKPESEE